MAEIGGTNYPGFCSGGHIINTYLAYISTITYVSYTRCGEKELHIEVYRVVANWLLGSSE